MAGLRILPKTLTDRSDVLGVLLDRVFAGLPAQAALTQIPSAAFAALEMQVADKPIPDHWGSRWAGSV